MKKSLILTTILFASLLVGCNTPNENPSNATEFMVSSFENEKELSYMRFPFKTHVDRGVFEFSKEHVTDGERSIKFTNTHGHAVEMAHYFSNLPHGKVDVSNIKSIDVDIYNDSYFDSVATLNLYSGSDMSILLSAQFELKKGVATHISFPVSKIALSYNADNVVCSTIRLSLDKTDYNKAIGYTFYIDNWNFQLGSEFTEEDLAYQPKIDNIVNLIDSLPYSDSVNLTHEDTLYTIAKEMSLLPDLYRRIIPNVSKYRDSVLTYYDRYNEEYPINFDLNPYIEFNKFVGAALLEVDTYTKAEVYYTEETWEGNEYAGSTKISFGGSQDSKFIYNSVVELADFDFVTFKVHNASENFVRIWFSYDNQVYLEIPSGKTVEATFPANALTSQSYWAILHNASMLDTALIPASGDLYFGYSFVKGRSEETLQEHLAYALSKLPESVASVTTEQDYFNMLSPLVTAKELFYEVQTSSSVSDEQFELMQELEFLAEKEGYHLAYNAYDSSMIKWSYGVEFNPSFTRDENFGFLSEAHITTNPVHAADPYKVEQGITFYSDVNFSTNSTGDYTIFVYNPTEYSFDCAVKSTNWNYWTSVLDATTLNPGWNRIDFRSYLFEISEDGKVCFLITGGTSSNPVDMSHENPWLFSSLFRLPRSHN